MIDEAWARQFAQEWVETWNSHDLDRILSHYTDDFTMSSPLIVERMKEPTGTLTGKDAVRPYWQIGLSATPPLRFELIDVFTGVDSIVIHYRRASGKLAAEVLMFDDQRRVMRGIAHYGQ